MKMFFGQSSISMMRMTVWVCTLDRSLITDQQGIVGGWDQQSSGQVDRDWAHLCSQWSFTTTATFATANTTGNLRRVPCALISCACLYGLATACHLSLGSTDSLVAVGRPFLLPTPAGRRCITNECAESASWNHAGVSRAGARTRLQL